MPSMMIAFVRTSVFILLSSRIFMPCEYRVEIYTFCPPLSNTEFA